MSDLISRQAAVELIKNYCENGCDIVEDNWCPSCQREQFMELLKAMPSVIPKGVTVTDFADKCRECGREKVLDRIRAEIEQNAYPIVSEMNKIEQGMTLYEILRIIDKPKAESEEV